MNPCLFLLCLSLEDDLLAFNLSIESSFDGEMGSFVYEGSIGLSVPFVTERDRLAADIDAHILQGREVGKAFRPISLHEELDVMHLVRAEQRFEGLIFAEQDVDTAAAVDEGIGRIVHENVRTAAAEEVEDGFLGKVVDEVRRQIYRESLPRPVPNTSSRI